MIRNWLRAFVRGEQAQDAFEYVLIIGVVVVAVLIAIATPVGSTMINAVLEGVCAALNTLPGVSGLITDCVGA
jgi:Flp pilus assembly pilin Flp